MHHPFSQPGRRVAGRARAADTGPSVPPAHAQWVYGAGDLDALVTDFFLMSSGGHPHNGKIRAGDWTELAGLEPDGYFRSDDQVVRLQAGSYPGCQVTLFRRRPLILDEAVSHYFERAVRSYFEHFPAEPTLARGYGVPLLYGRIDAVFGTSAVKIAEIDDQASFASLMKYLNPAADSWFIGLEKLLAADGQPLRLIEQQDPFAGTARGYHHTDADWLPRLMPQDDPDDFSVLARARRWVQGFEPFNDAWEARNILSGRHRDYKGVLAPMGLALMTSDIDVAIDASRRILQELRARGADRDARAVMIKGVHSARCEQVWAVALGDRGRGMDGLEKVRSRVRESEARLGGAERLGFLIQDYVRPLTAADLGLLSEDEFPSAGQFHVLGRIFFVCLPDAAGVMQPTIVGGLAQARTTPTRIHGANDAITFSVVRPGLRPCPVTVSAQDRERYRARGRGEMTAAQQAAYHTWDRLPLSAARTNRTSSEHSRLQPALRQRRSSPSRRHVRSERS